jgi:hypothetical protein
MNRLPQELADRIASLMPRNDLKTVLMRTREFRCAAERYSSAFAQFTIDERNSRYFSSGPPADGYGFYEN